MGKGWDHSQKVGRADRLRQEVRHRLYGEPAPVPTDYTGCCGGHASYYRRGWNSVTELDILHMCQRVKEKYGTTIPDCNGREPCPPSH